MTEVSLAVAFAAGLLSFVSPCVLALLPVYLAFLGNAAVADDAGSGTVTATRSQVLPQAILFVTGFSVLFIVLGTAVGLLGGPLFRIPEARMAVGALVIGLGLLTTGAFGPVLDRFSVSVSPEWLPAARSTRALALGGLVAVGWTPCIGPVLGAIFTMGASSGSAPAVAVLLTAYSLGLAVPFVLAALAFPQLRPLVALLRRHHRVVRVVTGLLIVLIGVLIYQNAFATLAGLFTWAL